MQSQTSAGSNGVFTACLHWKAGLFIVMASATFRRQRFFYFFLFFFRGILFSEIAA